ncbi:MAG TPA: hypothetical protein VN192_02525 [Flavobacterium sp.]|nr:hypothetical protein [Flavobacterium sp.]
MEDLTNDIEKVILDWLTSGNENATYCASLINELVQKNTANTRKWQKLNAEFDSALEKFDEWKPKTRIKTEREIGFEMGLQSAFKEIMRLNIEFGEWLSIHAKPLTQNGNLIGCKLESYQSKEMFTMEELFMQFVTEQASSTQKH